MGLSFDPKILQTISGWLGVGSINVFGAPYAGKDTQSKTLARLLDAKVIGSGDITRSQGSKNLKQRTEAGFLAPTEEFLSLVLPYFSREDYKTKPLILSSVGRWSGEEKPIMQAAASSGHSIKAAVLIQISEDAIWRRWETARHRKDRGVRYDDDKEKLVVRLKEFRTKTLPVVDFYLQRGLLVEVNGEASPKSVSEQIVNSLFEMAQKEINQ